MTEIKYVRNSRLTDPWACAIGKFVLNFGLLELESHLWLLHMPNNPLAFPDLWFSKRISEIQGLVDQRAFTEEWKVSATESWQKALHLAEFRNQVCHSPLMFGWASPVEQGEPDWIGAVDVRLLGQGRKRAESQLSLAGIAQRTGVVASLVKKLSGLRDAWCETRDKALMTKETDIRGRNT